MVLVGVVTASTLFVSRVVEVKAAVERNGRQGLASIQSGFAALGQSQFAAAAADLQAAGREFATARQKLKRFTIGPIRAPFFGRTVATTDRLLSDAGRLADLGERLVKILPPDAGQVPAVTITDTGIIQGSIGILNGLLEHRQDFLDVIQDAVNVAADVAAIDARTIPGAVRDRVVTWQRLLSGFAGSGQQLDQLTKVLLGLLVPSEPKEYLIVFQNNDELRPTGGFLGTYLLVKIEQGTFKILDAPGNGPYALSDEFARVNLPPQPLTSIVKFWTFHDANWFLDAPTSAQTMLTFYAQDRGFKPDGIIFFSPGVMEDLLRVTGPVRPEHYQIDISADNFVPATEQQVEFGYDKAKNNPKQFLIDLVPLMLQKLSQLNSPDAMRAIALTLKRANQGDILIYSRAAALQEAIVKLGWDGSVLPVTGDAVAVVDSNLGGGKTDRYIDEQVKTTVTLDGTLLRHVVAVTRTHRGPTGDILHGNPNKDFIRVYAPPDASFIGIDGATIPEPDFFMAPDVAAKLSPELLTAEGQTLVDNVNGYRITHESGRMVFGAWSRIEAGQSRTVTFTYTTPAPNAGGPATWQLDWQHQPGAPLRSWQVEFNLPQNRQTTVVNGTGVATAERRTVIFKTDSTISRSFSVTYK